MAIDLDVKGDGAETWARLQFEHGILPATRVHQTQSGGRHVLLRGSAPPSVRRLGNNHAPGVDVRGRDSYILWPGSVIDGKPYLELDKSEPAEAPQWLIDMIAKPKRREREAVDELDAVDLLRAKARALEDIALAASNGDLPEHGNRDDWYTRFIARMRGLGLVGDDALDMVQIVIDHGGAAPDDWGGPRNPDSKTMDKIARAEAGMLGDNPLGSELPKLASDLYDPAIAAALNNGAGLPDPAGDHARRREKFRLVSPLDAMRRKAPTYWDKDKLFIHIPGGSFTLIYAAFSNYKTTFSAGHALAVAKATGARVLYVVGEGAGVFGPLTLQAAVRDWNDHHADDQITDEWLVAHFQLVENAPQLRNPADLEAFVDAARPFNPDLLFLDTLGSAAAGENLSAIDVGTAIGANTRELARTLDVDCFLIHHEGKDASRGAMGSRYIAGNDPDMMLALEHDDKRQKLTVTVEKDRAGRRGRQVVFGTRGVFGIRIEGEEGPGEFVAVHEISGIDYRQFSREDDDRSPQERLMEVYRVLAERTKTEEQHITARLLALYLYPRQRDETPEEYELRLKDTAGDLARLAQPKGKVKRQGRLGMEAGALSGLVKMAGKPPTAQPYKPYRFFLPDHIRATLPPAVGSAE